MKKSLVLLALALVGAGCSKEEPVEVPAAETASCVKDAVRAIYRLETATCVKGEKPTFTSLDVAGMSAKELKKKFKSFARPKLTHLWMPGAEKWIVVEHVSTNGVALAEAMEAFVADDACAVSLPETFASYVGTLSEVLPAFESRLEGTVVPEWFVTKSVPSLAWLKADDSIDADILAPTLAEIRSMQIVRRVILEGNMAAARATDKASEEAATLTWAKAYLRNPNDPMLNERRENLKKNALGFLSVNKPLQAMKCFETLVLINPNDSAAVYGFGKCLELLGRTDLSKDVIKRSEDLEAGLVVQPEVDGE